ncbi:MAG: indole-3-glycerol phosphate synthase TrpC [Aquificae bacterium]|nr:indole-3-glycerol phosphate synthase TrpC [Aquificota bacterium]
MSFLERVRELKLKSLNFSPEYLKFLKREAEKCEPKPFEEALKGKGVKVIAEVKKASPSLGTIKEVDPAKQAKLYEQGGARAVSVLTESRYFNGSLEDLKRVRAAVSLPVLRKDFIVSEHELLEARAFGADAVLLIVAMLTPDELKHFIKMAYELELTPLVEVFSLEEGLRALEAGARVLGVNNRDLKTLKVDLSVGERLVPALKEAGAPLVVAESGIETKEDLNRLARAGADAFLIGTALMKSGNPLKKLRELIQ